MFKRVTWVGTGMVIGAGGAFWAKRRVEETVQRYLPEQVAERAATGARDLGRTVKAAASEGRQAMRQREQELRDQVASRTFGGVASPPLPDRSHASPAASRGRRRSPR